MSKRIADNPLVWDPNPRAPIQVRVHRLDGVAVWDDFASMRTAEKEAIAILHGESVAPPGYVGPHDLVEVVDTRRRGRR